MTSREYAEIDRRLRGNDALNDNQVLSYEDGDVYISPFTSAHSGHLIGPHEHKCLIHGLTFSAEETDDDIADSDIEENIRFRYPLVREPTREVALRRHDRVIILLHGLNERSFTKYMLWAFRLRLRTEIPVLLFPPVFSHQSQSTSVAIKPE